MEYLHINTPLIESVPLGAITGRQIFLKMDAAQPAHSFKIRGIGLLCQNAFGRGYRKLVSSSGGNAGLATAYAGRKLGMAVTIFVPTTTSQEMIERLRNEGAEVKVSGSVWDEAHAAAMEEASKQKARLVHPFDDPELWQGHASLVKEVSAAGIRPDAVFLSVGGGGLMCGVLEGLHAVGWKAVPVFAVETEGAASLAASYNAGQLTEISKINSIATSLGAKRISQAAFDWRKKHSILPVTVTDKSALEACYRFSADHKMLVEPACGASLAPIYENSAALKNFKKILVVVCGGFGVSIDKMNVWQKSLAGM